MALDINNIKQASPKANQVATEQYVDTSIAAIDVSGDINSNNDAFAVSQGFISYSDMATKYSALGKTIINGGYINTGLVRADSIVADSAFIKKLLAQNIVMDTSVAASSITSSNGNMKIDFKNGSIYIA